MYANKVYVVIYAPSEMYLSSPVTGLDRTTQDCQLSLSKIPPNQLTGVNKDLLEMTNYG